MATKKSNRVGAPISDEAKEIAYRVNKLPRTDQRKRADLAETGQLELSEWKIVFNAAKPVIEQRFPGLVCLGYTHFDNFARIRVKGSRDDLVRHGFAVPEMFERFPPSGIRKFSQPFEATVWRARHWYRVDRWYEGNECMAWVRLVAPFIPTLLPFQAPAHESTRALH
jgi:hypothetical protein